MIARYHGHDVDLNGLRQRFSLSLAGASLRSLMGIADQLGFSTRALRAEIGGLGKVHLPGSYRDLAGKYAEEQAFKSLASNQASLKKAARDGAAHGVR